MFKEVPMNQSETSQDTINLETEIRNAVEQGRDVQEMVRQLTLRKISAYAHDLESLRVIAGAVLRGARTGVQKELNQSKPQTDLARERLEEAVSGLDAALAQFALAAKLAVEEAAGRAQKVSSEDLLRMCADLECLDEMLLETLKASASGAIDAAGEILRDLAAHLFIHGSSVGAQANETLAVLARQLGSVGRVQAGIGLHLAQATSGFLRQIAAGTLGALADYIQPKRKGD
jgi:hypothetical protein